MIAAAAISPVVGTIAGSPVVTGGGISLSLVLLPDRSSMSLISRFISQGVGVGERILGLILSNAPTSVKENEVWHYMKHNI